jgi:fluoride exporter
MNYFWVAVGSALGGVARYWCGIIAERLAGVAFPWGTLFVNVTGSFAIGLFFALTSRSGRFETSETAKLFFMTGICGGYTTFSAFSLQTLSLLHDGDWFLAAANVLASVLLCLIAVWAGYRLGLA